MKYDVLIKSAPKDYIKLPLVINSLENLNPQPENVYVLSPDGVIPECNYEVIPVKDEEVFPNFNKNSIKFRPNWCWATFVALFQKFTKNDLYLDVQSDNVFLRPINLFEGNTPKFFISPTHNQHHGPYFVFMEKMFSLKKELPGRESFIIDFMLYNRILTQKLLNSYDDNIYTFLRKASEVINGNCHPTEQDTYGNFCLTHYPDEYIIKKEIGTMMFGKNYPKGFTVDEMRNHIHHAIKNHSNIVSISFHTWT